MALSLLGFVVNAYTAVSTAKEAKDILEDVQALLQKKGAQPFEEMLADSILDKFEQEQARLAHLCHSGAPLLPAVPLRKRLGEMEFEPTPVKGLKQKLVPIVMDLVLMPGCTVHASTYQSSIELVVELALDDFWKKASADAQSILAQLAERQDAISSEQRLIRGDLTAVRAQLTELVTFYRSNWEPDFDFRKQRTLPREYKIQGKAVVNPFFQTRAEDFNHNFLKLAQIFQDSPEWSAITSRTDNVILTGGRGTGKSMFLRRMTAQACLEARRQAQANAGWDDVPQDYFGIYIKLARGNYDQFELVPNRSKPVANILAQHDLNLEIYEAFVSTLAWLEERRALPPGCDLVALVRELNALFPEAPKVTSLRELSSSVASEEKLRLGSYFTDAVLGQATTAKISAQTTVVFVGRLARIFRARLFPQREIRLCLLLDEYEALLKVQQVSVNTLIKMRLPDLSVKVAVRIAGVKTHETFTNGDPIQYPRDYTPIFLDYRIDDAAYVDLLRGIAAKRLREAGLPEISIEKYLPAAPAESGVTEEEIQRELELLWQSGRRRSPTPTADFPEKYRLTAIHRAYGRKKGTMPYAGFKTFVTLSSGITSNFMELCKYAFFHALEHKLELDTTPEIPATLQSRAVYEVSHKQLKTVEGNVPQVGISLRTLVNDLGTIMRARLRHHSSETECNRIAIDGYDQLNVKQDAEFLRLMNDGITWSVFHHHGELEAHRPKHSIRPPTLEISLNRIYAPALEISPRSRWRLNMPAARICALTVAGTRDATFKQLMGEFGGDSDGENPGFLPGWEDKTDE